MVDAPKRKLIVGAWAFAIGMMLVIAFGYTVGKDMALRDNAADRAMITP